MSADVEAVYAALLSNRVPQQWAKVGYPSLLPLQGWLKDLQARVAFFQAWLRRGQPTSFWLAAFFFPQVLPDQPPSFLQFLPSSPLFHSCCCAEALYCLAPCVSIMLFSHKKLAISYVVQKPCNCSVGTQSFSGAACRSRDNQ